MRLLSKIWGFFTGRSTTTIQAPAPTPISAPLSTDPMKPIRLIGDSTCTMAELAELTDLEISLNDSVMSQRFEDFILSTPRIDLMLGRSRKQIVLDMRAPINLTISYYENVNTRVDGYEDSNTPGVVHINRLAMSANKFTKCDKVGLILHERSHCAGYYHISNYARPNYYTVPYLMTRACGNRVSDVNNGGCCS